MLQVTLSLAKETYATEEAIPGKITITNNGDSAALINGRLAINSPFAPEEFCDVYFTITNLEGKEEFFGSRINIGEPEAKDFKELAAGQTVDLSFNLRNFYNLKTPGGYSVQATYQNVSDPGD